jgi:hypothetical protein
MASEADQKSSIIHFKGKSGERYRFQAWPMNTKFKAIGGIYVVTKRACENRTFPTKASHQPLAIGQTGDLAASFVTTSERNKLVDQGANCVCVCPVADETRRLEIEKDLIEGNQWGGGVHYLFRTPVPEKAPGVAVGSESA